MKKLFSLIVLVTVFIHFNCTTDPDLESENIKDGGVSLIIDKSSVPEGINQIVATLSREGYSDIIETMNVLSDTSAEIYLNNVPIGEWNVNVDAKNTNDVVLYSGQGKITVKEFEMQSMSIYLYEADGLGRIRIGVIWGTGNSNWSDYQNNPVLSFTGSSYDNLGVSHPKVIYDNGIYKMWYRGLTNGSRSYVCYAESQDGFTWNNPVQNPVLSPGTSGSWDATAVIAGAVIKDDSLYKMYYVGWSDQNGSWNIGLATSTDGINWTKYPYPVMLGTSDWEAKIVPASVIKVNGTYYLYYYGDGQNRKIGLALSNDGINWTRYSQNPILIPTESWEGSGIFYPSVVKDGYIYRMVYSNQNTDAFCMATSYDGKTWYKKSEPFFKASETSNSWASNSMAYPCYVKVNDKFRVYYSGYSSGYSYQIGVMTKN